MDDTSRLNVFAPVSYENWRELVEKDLKGADFEKRLVKRVAGGIAVQPLYVRSGEPRDVQGLPGTPPFVRGAEALGRVEMGWDRRCEDGRPHVREASAVLEEELAGGVSSLSVRFDSSVRHAEGEPVGDGVLATQLGALEVLFEGVDLATVPVALQAGANALPVAASFFALASRRNVPTSALSGWLYADPIGTLLEHGRLPRSLPAQLDELSTLGRFCADRAPGLRAAVVHTAPYHDAGADAVQELAIAVGTGIVYLRALVDAGLSVDAAAQQIGFDFSVGRDFFLEIAKLRAARKLWSRVVEVAGGGPEAQAMRTHVRTSARTKTARDPWVNLLRGTAESFAAAVGGADSISTQPFDVAIGPPDAFARRIARNTQAILQEESNLHRVADPAGGSWYVEALTDALAQAAWQRVQGYEAEGGVDRAIVAGSLQEQVAASAARDAGDVAKRKLAITGVNEFPFLKEPHVERPAPDLAAAAQADREVALPAAGDLAGRLAAIAQADDVVAALQAAAAAGASLEQLRAALGREARARAEALAPAPFAAGFEALRDRSDRALAKTGKRPRVFLANLGPIPQHKARAAFATNFFEAGGIEALGNDGFADVEAAAEAFAQSGAELACLCSSDELYAEHARAAGQALAARGPKAVILAGKPADARALEAAGFTDFIFMGSDVQATLASLLDRVGA